MNIINRPIMQIKQQQNQLQLIDTIVIFFAIFQMFSIIQNKDKHKQTQTKNFHFVLICCCNEFDL